MRIVKEDLTGCINSIATGVPAARYLVIKEPINETGICREFKTEAEAQEFIREQGGGETMLNPKNLANGQEQYETFKSSVTRKKAVQYDYRHTDGELFSCVKPTLEACRQAKENWIKKTAQPQ